MGSDAEIDPIQPHTDLYLRFSMDNVRDLRNTVMANLSMSYFVRSRAHEKLFLLGMVNRESELTGLGKFAAEIGCQPENAVFLWYAHEFGVMEDALTIFAALRKRSHLDKRAYHRSHICCCGRVLKRDLHKI